MAVAKEIKETIAVTIDEVFKKMNSISWLERQKAMKDEAFKNTEKILYCFNILKEHVADEEGYLAMIQKSTSGSIVRYQKNKVDKPDEDQLLEDRIASYNRSKNDVERIEKALKKIEGKKGYEVIEMRYLQRKKTVENGKQVTYKITTRYHKEVTPDMFIKFKDRYFQIVSIINVRERNEMLEIVCTEKLTENPAIEKITLNANDK